MQQPEPRGIRNNNPGNLRHSKTIWMGQDDEQPDKEFVKFEAPKYGIRALYKVLLTYQAKHNLKTVADIINRWAPPSENDTGAYVRSVAKACGIDADTPVDVAKRPMGLRIVKAIINHENGQQPYTDELITEAIELAL